MKPILSSTCVASSRATWWPPPDDLVAVHVLFLVKPQSETHISSLQHITFNKCGLLLLYCTSCRRPAFIFVVKSAAPPPPLLQHVGPSVGCQRSKCTCQACIPTRPCVSASTAPCKLRPAAASLMLPGKWPLLRSPLPHRLADADSARQAHTALGEGQGEEQCWCNLLKAIHQQWRLCG